MTARQRLAWALLALAAVFSRFYLLGERVPHHDEAVHAHLARELLLLGQYRYDPTYHGPLQFYVLAPLMAVFGQNDFVARSWSAACGVALVLVPFLLRRRLGHGPALAAGFLMLLSPTLTYYARFARNDTPVALFTLAAVALILAGQRSRRYAFPALGILAALHLASKETFYVYGVVMGAALFGAVPVWSRKAREKLERWVREHRLGLLSGVLAFLAVTLTAYTVFFRFPEDAFFWQKAFSYWWGQHKEQRVAGPPWYYLPRLGLYEFAILGLAAAFFWQRRRRLSLTWRFFLLWGLFSLGMYAYLGEKVPWLAVHQLLPWCLPAGAALAKLLAPGGVHRYVLAAALVAGTAWSTLQSSFWNAAIEPATGKAELLVYVQTVPSFAGIIAEGRKLAEENGEETVLAVAGEAGWPLSWSWANIPVWWDKPQAGQNIRLFLCDPGQEQDIVNTLGRAYGCGEVPLRAWWVEEFPVSLRDLVRWWATRQAWSPLGWQSVVVCRQVPSP
ncbi:MAG: flippase activity-associated protein Agl23 [Thermoanaerobaculum sp.]